MGQGSPLAAALALGISITVSREAPFRVASTREHVAYAWHPDAAERESRAWEGIAQCLLERCGIQWTESGAQALARFLSSAELLLN
jgi:hypothetical protein